MSIRCTRAVCFVVTLMLLTTGCGASDQDTDPTIRPTAGARANPTDSPTSAETEVREPPDGLVLRITAVGGLPQLNIALTGVPRVSLYEDGRLLTVEGTPWSRPQLPELRERRLTQAGVRSVLTAAEEAGLVGPTRDYGAPDVFDLPTTIFVVYADDRRYEHGIYALGFDEGVPRDVREARERVSAFVERLSDLSAWLGDETSNEHPYKLKRLMVFVRQREAGPEKDVADWPLRDLGAVERGFGDDATLSDGWPFMSLENFTAEIRRLRCFAVDGDDIDTVISAVNDTKSTTVWRSNKETYELLVRPLLPDEPECPRTVHRVID